jgi:hypothetical protein
VNTAVAARPNSGMHGSHGRPGGGAGGVELLLHTESNSPVDVMITFTAFDAVEGVDVFS